MFSRKSFASSIGLALVLLAGWVWPSLGASSRLMVDLSPQPDAVRLSVFDLCVVDAAARVDLESQQALGNQMLARVNLLECRRGETALAAARSIGLPTVEASDEALVRLDATHPHWPLWVVHERVRQAAEQGFDGFVLAGLETLSQDAERAACLMAIQRLHEMYPDKKLVLEGAADLLPETARYLDAALFFQGQNPTEADIRRIRQAKRMGLQPLVVERCQEERSLGEIQERAGRYRSMGALSCFTSEALDGTHHGPMQEIRRQILVLHSGPARATFAARLFQGPLTWMGYHVRYATLEEQGWEKLAAEAQGVILDATLKTRPEQQPGLLAMAEALLVRETPLLLTCAPWGNEEEFRAWAALLDLDGTGTAAVPEGAARLVTAEQDWRAEAGALRPRAHEFRDLRAGKAALRIATVQGKVKGRPVLFDQVFLAPWGGLWLEPLATRAGPQFQPLRFLEAWSREQPLFPVPDTASQNGRRLMVATVSSEGFSTPARLPGLPLAAEAMSTRLLARYSLPFTVAVCEGEVRAQLPGQDETEALRYEAAARQIFALPNVEAASASFSRPSDWSGLEGMRREVAGSLAYIHRQLLPPGHRVPLMLWPQGAWPDAETVAFSRKMGVENLLVMPSGHGPGGAVSAPAASWGRGEAFQTFLPGNLQGQGGQADASMAGRQRESTVRWLAPVHVGLSFEDAADEKRLWEAERLLDWCASQPLCAMPGSEYARLVRDAARTRIFVQGDRHWIVVNEGHARTLRLPATAGVPDLERSAGLAGYTVRGGELYVHTLGLRRTELVLTDAEAPDHLRLAVSSGRVHYLEAGRQRALLQVADVRPVELTFAGIEPGAMCQVYTSERPQFVLADTHGQVQLTVPPQTTVKLQIITAPQAAMRLQAEDSTQRPSS